MSDPSYEQLDDDTYNFLWGVRYFHEERGNMTRLLGFDEEKLRKAAPIVYVAWMQYKVAERALDAAVQTLPEETR